ncbi:hypothetical protein [Pseudoalteromonas sp. R3]|uniref:hypothetical protein n=1 Tax=Pseudoalteromonas sp. R3 TaxID=1709477 RepID=UPI0006B63F93|nr:hypothetical protein [Pseudoalteromonas sp. R3]AZZ99438.1 hypothetical protein ELR70_21560 [Pseudoalteromonas sp. R3]
MNIPSLIKEQSTRLLEEITHELFTQEQYECWYHLGFTQQTDHPVYFWEEAGNNQALLEVIKNIPNNNK